jgi:AcrR family transcriptional regulator
MSPRSLQANQRLHEAQKERILSAALPLFAQQGLAATKMADIASAAEMGYGSVYHYFPDKEAIFTALIERMMQESIQHTHEALAMLGTPWERLHWWFSRTLLWVQKHPEITLFITQVLSNAQEHKELRQLAYHLTQAAQQEVRCLIVKGQEAGQVIAGDADQLAMVIQFCLHGLAIEAAFAPDQERPAFPDATLLLRFLKA